MTKLEIAGYEQEGNCEHCGRALKHVIKTSDGTKVGATCFDKVLTAPRTYYKKTYRVGPQEVIRLARFAEKFSAKGMARYGIYPEHLKFDRA